jgi:hypothetical protein
VLGLLVSILMIASDFARLYLSKRDKQFGSYTDNALLMTGVAI